MEAQKDTPMSGPNIVRYRTPGPIPYEPGVRYRAMFGPDIGVSFWASIEVSWAKPGQHGLYSRASTARLAHFCSVNVV